MRFSRKFAALSIVAASALVAGGAFAYFTASGSGTGSATVGSSSPWTVTDDGTSGPVLLPGAGVQTVSYTVTNASAGQQGLTDVVVTVDDSPGCDASNFTVDNSLSPGPTVLAGGDSVSGSADITMNTSLSSQDGCQGDELVLSIDVVNS